MTTNEDYLRFAFDWLIELLAIIPGAIVIVMTGSLYSGLCLYINGMVADMKASIPNSAFDSHLRSNQPVEYWSIFVKEIDFHIEIIE